LDAGAAIAADISQIIVGVLAELHAGNPARFVVGGDPDSLVEHLLAANGVSSMVTVPIHCDDEGLLLLALGTGSSDAFLDVGRSFFIELGHGLSKTVLPLVAIKDDPSGNG
jgi:hypothetical protein